MTHEANIGHGEVSPRKLDISPVFHSATVGSYESALDAHRQRFEAENLNNPLDKQIYHVVPHLEIATFRAALILKEIQKSAPDLVSDRDIDLAVFLMPRHDQDQDYKVVHKERSGRMTKIRERTFPQNETNTTTRIEEEMRRINTEHQEEVFTRNDFVVAKQATMLTVPDFRNGTVVQPGFAGLKDVLVAQVEGLADIGGGMKGFDVARWETFAVFLEDEIDMGEIILDGVLNGKNLTKEDQAWAKTRTIDRLREGVVFQEEQAKQREKDIKSMKDERVQEVVGKLFGYYSENIKGIEGLIADFEKMSFPEIRNYIRGVVNNPPHPAVTELLAA